MTLISLLSLAFSAWMAWTLYTSLREEKFSGYVDWLSTVWIASGSAAGIVVAAMAIARWVLA